MHEYNIEHRILSLVQCAVSENKDTFHSFSVEDMLFSHWDFNFRDGWRENAWLVKGKISSKDVVASINTFREGLSRIVPRVALISQAYIEYFNEPFLICKANEKRALLRYVKDVPPVPLMFTEKQRLALQKLLCNKDVPEAFYKYWNDAVNASGYSAKLLLMCAAMEAMVKKNNGKKNWTLMEAVLGKDLKDKIFAPKDGLRHRLSHGEYFMDKDSSGNYVEAIHKRVISYFNSTVFMEPLLGENIVHPQRHFFGNKEAGVFFVERKDGCDSFSLKELIEDLAQGQFKSDARYMYSDNQNREGY